jgi:hypothetical protein
MLLVWFEHELLINVCYTVYVSRSIRSGKDVLGLASIPEQTAGLQPSHGMDGQGIVAQEYDADAEILQMNFFRSGEVTEVLEQIVKDGGIFRHGWSLGFIRHLLLRMVLGDDLDSHVLVDESFFGGEYRRPCPPLK